MNGSRLYFYVICLSKLENQSGTTDANAFEDSTLKSGFCSWGGWVLPIQEPYWARGPSWMDAKCQFFFNHRISVNLLRCWFGSWTKRVGFFRPPKWCEFPVDLGKPSLVGKSLRLRSCNLQVAQVTPSSCAREGWRNQFLAYRNWRGGSEEI